MHYLLSYCISDPDGAVTANDTGGLVTITAMPADSNDVHAGYIFFRERN